MRIPARWGTCVAIVASWFFGPFARAATLDEWIKERAEEYRAYLHGGGSLNPDALWRRRGSSDTQLSAFVAPSSLAPLIRAVSPGVVNISTVNSASAGATHRSLGSGFILSPLGYVVTNNHVVEAAQDILIKLSDGREFSAEIVGRDRSTDVAVLRLLGDRKDLPFTFLGDSDQLEVGDWVVAIGNPFGLDRSVSHGIISAKERVLGVGIFDDFIQTDALINPGNSGGPLFNMRGEVVAVNTAILSQGQGIGFAVPINMVKELLPNLLENGHVARGWLGINIEEVPSSTLISSRAGAVVKEVYRSSPAALVGIQRGDRLIRVNGKTVESYLKLLRSVTLLGPGTEVRLEVQRNGVTREYVVKLSERPVPESTRLLDEAAGSVLGLVVKDISPDSGTNYGYGPGQGVIVAGVIPGSAAERAGIVAGDLITEVNRIRISEIKAYQAALRNSASDATALLRVQRGDSARYIAVKPN